MRLFRVLRYTNEAYWSRIEGAIVRSSNPVSALAEAYLKYASKGDRLDVVEVNVG